MLRGDRLSGREGVVHKIGVVGTGPRRSAAMVLLGAAITAAALAAPGGPVILQQPQSVSALSGQAVSFTVVASGAAPLSYQWQMDGFNITNGGAYSGAQSATLNVNPVSPGLAGQYFVTVGDANKQFVLSDPATLSIAPPPADECAAAGTVTVGSTTAFATLAATTSTPNEPGACFDGTGELSNDVWFKFGTSCVGTITVSLCPAEGGSADFDARLAVYTACPTIAGGMVACSDNSCGSAPSVSFANAGPTIYRVRVGGALGANGTAMMSVACSVAPCPADVNDDGQVNINDLLGVIAAWGTAGGPADVNNSGTVDINDLLAVIAAWGVCA